MKLFLKACALTLLAGGMSVSCDSYRDDTPDSAFVEQDKNLDGVWQLSVVKRNGIDITSSMDFSRFRLHLNAEGTYTLQNRLPFPVAHDGRWSVDDPAHPFMLSFTEYDDDLTENVGIQYPIVEGKRQLSITHYPGCHTNKYEYVFVKVN